MKLKTTSRCAGLTLGFLVLPILLWCNSVTVAAEQTSRPNVVFILTDDQRWDALSCMGNPHLQTPNIDRLAAEGALFKNHFCTTSLCSPIAPRSLAMES